MYDLEWWEILGIWKSLNEDFEKRNKVNEKVMKNNNIDLKRPKFGNGKGDVEYKSVSNWTKPKTYSAKVQEMRNRILRENG